MSQRDPHIPAQSSKAATSTYTVTATEFRSRLFRLLGDVAAGKVGQVTITLNGTAVAVLGPFRRKDRGRDRLRIARVIAAIGLDSSKLPYHSRKEGTSQEDQ